MLNSYKELIVWQKSFKLSILIYKLTKTFPKDELYALVSQMRRASVSIPSNISEGYSRGHKLEYLQFLRISFGSGAELETQLLIAKEMKYITEEDFNKANDLLIEIQKMLNKMVSNLKSKP